MTANSSSTVVVRTRSEAALFATADATAHAAGSRAVVMTMGALHRGHTDLIDAARRQVGDHGTVIVTIFVNPLQFAPTEDLDRYPRTLDADLELCREHGADVVFAPTVETMYPAGDPEITVDPGPLGDVLEGAARPGHFRGVLTVVARLMHLTRPDVAVFGEKDYQQLVLIRKMVRDLEFPITVLPVATARDDDGLALSSRNRYLTGEHRAIASAVPRSLAVGAAAAGAGANADEVVAETRRLLADTAGVGIEYVTVTDPDLGPPPTVGPARLLVAVRIGGVRLLDNGPVHLTGSGSSA